MTGAAASTARAAVATTAGSSANQPPPFEGRNLFAIDAALRSALSRHAADWSIPEVEEWGATLGSSESYALADAANRNPPMLRTFDRRGERIDEVVFHPAWDALMRRAMSVGEHSGPWRTRRRGAHVARAAMYYLHAQVENGTQCPLTMTYACVPVLERYAHALPESAGAWLPKILAPEYDPRSLPLAEKRSALIGMGMTERQGGSDVRSNTTRAVPDREGAWRVTGHKWFFSAPQCDAHLVLAKTGEAIGCFLMPRVMPDGSRNAIRIDRLKDKLGNRSNASSEVQFDDAIAWPIGPADRGIATILEMVQYTRLDCVIGSAGILRAALSWAIHHARHRAAFGRRLVAQPLMTSVLADLALESEADMWLALRLAAACEDDADDAARAVSRIVTPATKFWVCKRAVACCSEAMEALGGNGYVEENPLPRLYREAPVNSIWEGSGNVVCLDVARAMRREPDAVDALLGELSAARGANRAFDAHCAALAAMLRDGDDAATGRRVAQAIAIAVSALELIRHAPAFVADAFCASRLAPSAFGGAVFGILPPAADTARIVERAFAE